MNIRKNNSPSAKPILPSELPKVRIDYLGLLKYAKQKGVQAIDLTDSEKNQFVYPE